MQIGTSDPLDQRICYIEAYNFPDQLLLDGLKLLRRILNNLLEYPREEKYSRLNKNNQNLKQFLFCIKGVGEFLRQIGFIELDDCFVFLYSDEALFELEKADQLLRNRVGNFQVMRPISEHPNYPLMKDRLQDIEEKKEYKKQLVNEFQQNREAVWEKKKFDPENWDPNAWRKIEQVPKSNTGTWRPTYLNH